MAYISQASVLSLTDLFYCSWDCVKKVSRAEGLSGLYKGKIQHAKFLVVVYRARNPDSSNKE